MSFSETVLLPEKAFSPRRKSDRYATELCPAQVTNFLTQRSRALRTEQMVFRESDARVLDRAISNNNNNA